MATDLKHPCACGCGILTRRMFCKNHSRRTDFAKIEKQVCQKCQVEKPLAAFGANKNNPLGKQYRCRVCREEDKQVSLANPRNMMRYKAAITRWRKKNKDRVNNRARVRREERIEADPSLLEEDAAKHRASRRKNREAYNASMRFRRAMFGAEDIDRRAKHKRRALKAETGGKFTAFEWYDLCHKHGMRCALCGKKKKLTVDHVIPISRGGANDIGNIQPLCFSCNSKKRTRIIDARLELWLVNPCEEAA